MPKFAILLRVSGERQKEDETILTQQGVARQHFVAAGIDPDSDVLWFYDDGVSGDMPIWSRPGGLQLRAAVEAGAITEAVYVYRIDRINRDDILSYFELETLLDQHGLSLRSLAEGIDTKSGGGRISAGVMALASREAKRQMLDHMRAGKKRNAERGRWQSGPPFGYTLHDGKLLVEEEQARVVRQVFALYVEERQPAGTVAATLNASGAMPTRTGRAWTTKTVLYLLRNTVYIGEGRYNRAANVRKGGRTVGERARKEEEWVTIPAPRIVPDELFERAQERLERAANYGGWKAKQPFLLRSLLMCKRCGRCFLGNNTTNKQGKKVYRYYRHRSDNGCPDRATRFYGDVLEADVWSLIVRASQQPDTWLDLIKTRYEGDSSADEAMQELRRIQGRAEAVRRKEELLLDTYLRGSVAQDLYERKAAELREQVGQLERQRRALLVQTEELPARAQIAMQTLTEEAAQIHADSSYEVRRRVVERLIKAIWVDGSGPTPHVQIEPR